jgi:PAS domain S-box-containing protein
MEDQLTQSVPQNAAVPNSAVPQLSPPQYEVLLDMTSQMLATENLDERLSLALDAITTDLGCRQAAIALIDEDESILRMRMALGFRMNAEVERIEIPLDSSAPEVALIHAGRPVWISRDGEQNAAFAAHFDTGSETLALPLCGPRWSLAQSRGGFARRDVGEYWEPKASCLGVLYIGADRRATEDAMGLFQRLADRIGALIASAMQNERLIASVRELQRERQWVESVMQSVADPIVLTNLDNEILLQNHRAEEFLSGQEDANEGKRRALKMNDFLFSTYLSSGAVSSTETLGRDLTLVDPIEGSEIHFEVISTPALNEQGERIGLVSVFRDVTDLRQANEELARNYRKLKQADAEARRERDRLNLIIENVGHPVVVSDANGSFVLFNQRAGLLFQQERRAEVLPGNADLSTSRTLAAVRSNSVKLTSFIGGLASETRSGRQAEIELIDPESGDSLPMEITSVEVLDPKGQVTAVVSVLHDLSEIRELERRRVEQKLFESEKLAAVGTLAASIAHEVNNPLEAIKNSLYLLQSTQDEEANARFLTIALKETGRVSNIIRRMLGFARRSGGAEWINVNQLIEETLALVERKLQHSGITVTQKLDPELPPVHGYPDQLRQVFLNLILNAQQSIDGTGTIEIRTSCCESSGQPSVAIQINDTGCGIGEEEMARIFEPFFSTRKDGTGLGLWVTQNIIRQHGGQIEVKSLEEKRTSFQILLPVDSPSLISAGQQ